MKIDDILTINTTLKPQIWRNSALKSQIKRQLVTVASDFFENLELKGANLKDITFTGSLANYNWTRFSDIDLHLIVDFSEIDENHDLVREFFSAKTSNWNKHHNIIIFGHEIELYVQDISEKHFSSGVYSLQNSEWLTKPERVEPKINMPMVKRKINSFVDMISRVEDLFDDKNYEQAHKFSLKLAKKIKKFRQSGLENEGVHSYENLAFKYLRNNEFIKTLYDVRNESYDKMMSIEGDFDKKFKIFVSSEILEEETGFHRLQEIEKYQKRVKRRHIRMKKRLIGLGKQKNTPPFVKKTAYKRSKSSPVGYGGS